MYVHVHIYTYIVILPYMKYNVLLYCLMIYVFSLVLDVLMVGFSEPIFSVSENNGSVIVTVVTDKDFSFDFTINVTVSPGTAEGLYCSFRLYKTPTSYIT